MDSFKLVISIELDENANHEENIVKIISYANCGADALIIRDRTKTDAEHDEFIGFLRTVSNECDIDIYAGGYIKKLEDVKKYLYAGAKKVFFTFEGERENAVLRDAISRFGVDKCVVFNSNFVKNIEDIKSANKLFNLSVNTYNETAEEKIEIINITEYDGDARKFAAAVKDIDIKSIAFNSCDIDVTEFMKFKLSLNILNVPVEVFDTSLEFSDFKLGPNGLIPVIAQDYKTGEVLMLAYMNEEAFEKTLATGMMTYYSRSRQELWTKGMTSGNIQFAKKLTIDCDKDTLLAQVHQIGAACHTGNRSCFFTDIASKSYTEKNPAKILEDVYNVILDRKSNPKEGSYTNYLFDKGIDKILKKCGEEATEIVIAAKNPDKEEIKYEIADFLYHMMVLMVERGVSWDEIMEELANR